MAPESPVQFYVTSGATLFIVVTIGGAWLKKVLEELRGVGRDTGQLLAERSALALELKTAREENRILRQSHEALAETVADLRTELAVLRNRVDQQESGWTKTHAKINELMQAFWESGASRKVK